MKVKILVFAGACAVQLVCALGAGASPLRVDGGEDVDVDSVRRREVGEVVVVADPKMTGTLAEQPFSYSVMRSGDIEKLGVRSLKDAAMFVPNLFMPDYGSRLTSAIYIRGIGSRINTPAVGLYVDDAAFVDKSAFDFNFLGVERIEVLRGPQSTLYGRNAMGGLIKVYTRDPRHEGTEVRLGASTKDMGRYVQFLTSRALTDKTSFSIGGFYKGSDGFRRNEFLDRRSDGGESGGGRFRWVYDKPSATDDASALKIDFQTGFEYSDEKGYDYYYTGDGNDERYEGYVGKIMEGELGGYRRNLLNSSLKVEAVKQGFIFTSVTSYQFFTDRMFMDQDFSPLSVFTLEQCQRSHNFSEEIVFKGNRRDKRQEDLHIDWTGGAFFSGQSLRTNAPVRFGADGVQQLIQDNIDRGFAAANAAMNPRGMNIAMKVTDRSLLVDGDFDTPVLNAAAFGQITLKNLWVKGLDVTGGLRLDYEHTKMDYNSGTAAGFNFRMTRDVQGMAVPLYNYDLTTASRYRGVVRKDYTQLLPKFAVTYHLNSDDMVYATVSKGFRSGGYNIQMFSDLIQTSLRNDMMRDLAGKIPMMNNFVMIADNPSADSTTVFKPETSWNYEIGTHLASSDGRFTAEAALFFVDTRNQQIARYAASGLGRQMVNAGRSQSYGADVALSALFTLWGNPLRLSASYGYTHAVFKRYNGGEHEGQSYVYDGNYVPFAPLHNFSAAVDYMMVFDRETDGGLSQNGCKLRSLSVGLNLNGAGRVYWTESNSVSQPFYALLGAHATADFGVLSLNVWGKNLTSTSYCPFYFESMNKGFAQKCKPLCLGVDVALKF